MTDSTVLVGVELQDTAGARREGREEEDEEDEKEEEEE